MVASVQDALRQFEVKDPVLAVGQFLPRGHTGSMFAGGLVGSGIGDAFGSVGDAIGTVGGALAGGHIHDSSSGLPGKMLVGVTATHVYGFAAASRHSPAGAMVFSAQRDDLDVAVHQRVNVRVLELIQKSSGARIELEGNRLPMTHSKDVINALTG